MYTITLSGDQLNALQKAILGGAFAQRQQQLHDKLNFNRSHTSIANGIEREIEQLEQAAAAIMNPEAVK